MTANEIRTRARLTSERSAFARYEQADWLAEIAAQLAELNENINRMVSDQGALDVVVFEMTALPAHDIAAMFTADDFRAQLLATAKKLHEAGMAARLLLANWPGTNDEQRRIDHAEFAALEFLASDALYQAERLMKLHERDEL